MLGIRLVGGRGEFWTAQPVRREEENKEGQRINGKRRRGRMSEEEKEEKWEEREGKCVGITGRP